MLVGLEGILVLIKQRNEIILKFRLIDIEFVSWLGH